MARLVEKSQVPVAPKVAAGPTVRNIDVFWDTPFDADVWKSIVTRTKGTRSYERHVEEKGGAHVWTRLGIVLPLGGQGLIADLVCVHAEKSDHEPLHWGLTLRPKPRVPPPKGQSGGQKVGREKGSCQIYKLHL